MSAQVPAVPEFFGGFFVLTFIALALYGIVLGQVWTYVSNFGKRDPWSAKIDVGLVTILETLHTAMAIHSMYWYVISTEGNVLELNNIVWSAAATILLETIMVALVQSFYIRKIYIMSGGNIWFPVFLYFILVFRSATSLACTALMYKLGTWSALRQHAMVPVIMFLSLSVLADFCIAATLMFYLWTSRSGRKSSDAIVNTLMIYCINSGCFTMLASTMILVTFLVKPESLVFAGVVKITSKLYANSLLGSLNMRSFLRRAYPTHATTDVSVTTSRGVSSNPHFNASHEGSTTSTLRVAWAPMQPKTAGVQLYSSDVEEHGHHEFDLRATGLRRGTQMGRYSTAI